MKKKTKLFRPTFNSRDMNTISAALKLYSTTYHYLPERQIASYIRERIKRIFKIEAA